MTDFNDIHKLHGKQPVMDAIVSSASSIPDHCVLDQGFKFSSAGDIIKNMRPISWLIPDYIEQHALCMMFGKPASGKSFIAIDIACCLATGMPYYDKKVKQGAVFYIAGEGHNGLARRFKAWEEKNKTSLNDAPLYVSEIPVSFCDKKNAEAVKEAINRLAEETGVIPCLIIVDTLARNFGGDENSNKDMSQFIQNLDMIKNYWKASTLVIHHSGHGDTNRERGATALGGAMDHKYRVKKTSKGVISLENTKMKDSPTPSPLYFKITSVPITIGESKKIMKSAALSRVEGNTVSKAKNIPNQVRRAIDILKNCLNQDGELHSIPGKVEKVLCVTMTHYRHVLKKEKLSSSDKPDAINRAANRSLSFLEKEEIARIYKGLIFLEDKTD